MTYIANSKGQSLQNHLLGVSLMCELFSRKIGFSEVDIMRCKCAGMLHDVGKATEEFQSYICGNPTKKEEEVTALHHEHSFEVLKNCSPDKSVGFDWVSLNAILWHHGKTVVGIRADSSLVSEDIERIMSVVNQQYCNITMVDDQCSIRACETFMYAKYPTIRNGMIVETDTFANAKIVAVRSVLVYCDHLVSSMSVDELDSFLNTGVYEFGNNDIDCCYTVPSYFSAERVLEQERISLETVNRDISIVPASAGFGKTAIGIMSTVKNRKRCYWVCPRNVVAENVYNTIIKELSAFGCGLSVELFLTGERLQCTDETKQVFGSDIVVTNIDNFTKPMVNHGVMGRLGDVFFSTVIFDEFHEFVDESPLFSAFVEFVKMRKYVNNGSKTILLSATPSIVETLWNKDRSIKSDIIPCDFVTHDKEFEIEFSYSVPSVVNDGIIITNSLKSSQMLHQRNNSDLLLHSYYTNLDKQERMDTLKLTNAKNGTFDKKVCSAPIVQASLDVSFSYMVDVVCSPETTLQRLGRLDRWGDKNNICKIVFCFPTEEQDFRSNESAAVNMVYSNNLNRKWFSMLRELCDKNKKTNLKTMYALYNKFNEDNSKELSVFLNEKFSKGLRDMVSLCYPKKYIGDNDTSSGGSGNLRSPEGNCYIVLKDEDDNWMKDVFSVSTDDLKRNENNGETVVPVDNSIVLLKNMKKLNEERIGFCYSSSILRGLKNTKGDVNMFTLIRMTRNSCSPLPVSGWYYSKKFGIVKNKH